MDYGISTSLRGRDCYLDRLTELRADGVTCAELCLRPEESAADCLRAAERIQAAGLRVWSIHLPFGRRVDPAEPDEGRRIQNMARVRSVVDGTAAVGAAVYVIHGSAEPVAQGAARTQALEAAARSLWELTEYMEPLGLTLALENLPRSCIGRTAAEIEFLLERAPGLKLCLDTNHFTPLRPDVRLRALQRACPAVRRRLNPEPVGDVVAYARRLAAKIVTVHLSDYDGIDECHWHPGQGIVDFGGIHQALTDAGFSAPLIFEPNERCRSMRTTGRRLIDGYERALNMRR